jgi:hypothetical protein
MRTDGAVKLTTPIDLLALVLAFGHQFRSVAPLIVFVSRAKVNLAGLRDRTQRALGLTRRTQFSGKDDIEFRA